LVADLDKLLDELSEDMENVVFFIGAGISVPSGSPTGFDVVNESIRILSERIKELKCQKKIRDLLVKRARPETLFNYFEVYRDHGNADTRKTKNTDDILNSALNGLKPTFIHNAIASFLNDGKIKTILSLNYDSLIEDAAKAKTELDVIHTPEHFETLILDLSQSQYSPLNRRRIVKFHGHLQPVQHSSVSLESGSLQYALLHLVPMNQDKAKCLRWFIRNHTLVFLGCSGNDDFDIAPILMGEEAKRLIWINHAPQSNMVVPTADPETYLTNPFKIIKRQNERGKCNHVHLTIDTGQFMKILLEKSGLSVRQFERKVLAGKDRFRKSFKNWIQEQPKRLPELVMASLVRDFGAPHLALELLDNTNVEGNDPNLECELRILKVELHHLAKNYRTGREIAKNLLKYIDNCYGFEKAEPLEKRVAVTYECQAHKRLAFMIRDEAQQVTDIKLRRALREEADNEFRQWETKLKTNKHVFKEPDFSSQSYQLNRDWAWLDRDAGKLTVALRRIERSKPKDPYNLAKSRLDGGWFAFDEAKRRSLKGLEKKDDFEKKAIEFFTEAIDVCKKQGFVDIEANALRSRAHVYIYQSMFREKTGKEENTVIINEKLKQDAERDMNEALRLFVSLGQDVERGITLYDLALFHHAHRDTQKARDYANQASIFLETGARRDALDKLNRLKRDLQENNPYERHFIENLGHIINE